MIHTVMSYAWDRMLLPFSSVAASGAAGVAAASIGHGIYRVSHDGAGNKMAGGLPDDMTVNRLRTAGDRLYACTKDGLYTYGTDSWALTDIAIPCYQLKMADGVPFVSTEYGLWCGDSQGGLSWYDRYTGTWAEIGLAASVTSLAFGRGALVGSTDRGELLIGDRRGRIDRYTLDGMFVFGVSELSGRTYACTDRGLFEIRRLRARPDLFAVKLGIPVTDVAECEGKLYLSTLSRGVVALDTVV